MRFVNSRGESTKEWWYQDNRKAKEGLAPVEKFTKSSLQSPSFHTSSFPGAAYDLFSQSSPGVLESLDDKMYHRTEHGSDNRESGEMAASSLFL